MLPGNKIKELRQRNGISQKALAKTVGHISWEEKKIYFCAAYLLAIEKGRLIPSEYIAGLIEKELGCGEGMMRKSELMILIEGRLAELTKVSLHEEFDYASADRIDAEVIARVREFLKLLDYNFPKPYLYPTPFGGIRIEWNEDCKHGGGLDIEFTRLGMISFELNGELSLDKPQGIKELLDWIR